MPFPFAKNAYTTLMSYGEQPPTDPASVLSLLRLTESELQRWPSEKKLELKLNVVSKGPKSSGRRFQDERKVVWQQPDENFSRRKWQQHSRFIGTFGEHNLKLAFI